VSSSEVDICWAQKGFDLEATPRSHRTQDSPQAEDFTINVSGDDILLDQPIYLTVAVKQGLSDVDPTVQLARWSVWSRLNETRNGVQDHFVFPAISVEDHVWKLFFHTYDANGRRVVTRSLPSLIMRFVWQGLFETGILRASTHRHQRKCQRNVADSLLFAGASGLGGDRAPPLGQKVIRRC
jgi:hypothetical protein